LEKEKKCTKVLIFPHYYAGQQDYNFKKMLKVIFIPYNLKPHISYAFITGSKHDQIKFFFLIISKDDLLVLNSLYDKELPAAGIN